eukprot:12319289-Alexandrium_andersonii.AAC.1
MGNLKRSALGHLQQNRVGRVRPVHEAEPHCELQQVGTHLAEGAAKPSCNGQASVVEAPLVGERLPEMVTGG